jgi:xanthine phosphoribosyltransferase
VIAITRGGLIPAAIIARALDICLVETVSVVTYRGKSSANPSSPNIRPPSATGPGPCRSTT